MIKNLKWYMSAIGLLLYASVYAIDFVDMGLASYYFLHSAPSLEIILLASITTIGGFYITYLFIRKLLSALKLSKKEIFIVALLSYVYFFILGLIIRLVIAGLTLDPLIKLLIVKFDWPRWVVAAFLMFILYVIVNACVLTVIIYYQYPKLGRPAIFRSMLYANILSLLFSIMCLIIFYMRYPQDGFDFVDWLSRSKSEPDRVREMVKNMPYSNDLSESDFR